MKKFLRTVRSMKFSLVLMLPLLVLFVLGSVIPQGETETYYQTNYPGAYHLILGFALNAVFSSPAFLLLSGLFGVNLLFCSLWQTGSVPKRMEAVKRAALASGDTVEVPPQALSAMLRRRGFREKVEDGKRIFVSGIPGWYGSVVTHFALLLVLLGGLGLFLFSSVEDYTVIPGEALTLSDGTIVEADSFRVCDESGTIDYTSVLRITDPQGRESGEQEVKVNHPLRFGSHKYYQQSYGAAGRLRITDPDTGEGQDVTLTQQGFITLNGTNGIWYEDVYPGYVLSEDGEYTLITETAGEYTDPIYYVIWVQDGVTTPMLILPGETLEAEDAVYSFGEPILYPGIRVKTTPMAVYGVLYASFVLLILGIYLCFFRTAAVVVSEGGTCRLAGTKTTEELRLRIELLSEEGDAESP